MLIVFFVCDKCIVHNLLADNKEMVKSDKNGNIPVDHFWMG